MVMEYSMSIKKSAIRENLSSMKSIHGLSDMAFDHVGSVLLLLVRITVS